MTILISDSFGTDTSANYNGGARTVTGGQVNCTGLDGFRIHTTQVGPGDRWLRIRILDATNLSIVCMGASGTGAGFGIVFDATGANLIVDWLTEYASYTSYQSNDDDVNASLGTYNAANVLGITLDATNEILRFWNSTTAAEPTSLTSWDGGAANGTVDFTGLQTLGGSFVGFGTWDTSGTPAESFDDFSAGTFGAAVSVLPIFTPLTNILLRR